MLQKENIILAQFIVKLLFDQNISYNLVEKLKMFFPNSNHVRLLGLEFATDEKIWEYARKNNFVIVTQDSDFNERSLLYGYPPKILWLRTGNTKTENIEKVIKTHHTIILQFGEDDENGCLEIY